MKKYSAEKIRNVAFFGHGSTGKTSTGEAMLFNTGVLDRMGKVEDGNTALDFDPDEVKRGISIYTALAPCEWKEHKLNCLDVPGFLDFIAEVKGSLRVIEGCVLFASANVGMEVGLERMWDEVEKNSIPAMLFVNKMDKENSDFYKVANDLSEKLGRPCVPLQVPIGSFDTFVGYVDLITETAYKYQGGKAQKADIPADLKDKVKEYRDKLVEAAAEGDDVLIEKFIGEEKLSVEEVKKGLKGCVKQGKLIPALCGSSVKNIGVDALMDAIIEYIPSPAECGPYEGVDTKTGERIKRMGTDAEPFSALVFKTTADPYVGKLTFMRLFSGILKSDSVVYNSKREKDEKIANLVVVRGKHQDIVEEVHSGDIVTVAKLTDTTTGDTLCTKDKPIRYDDIEFPEPVMAMAIYPKSKGDEDKLSSGLSKISDEDPTVRVKRDTETKESIISGMGELHVEIVKDRLKRKFGVDVDLVTPKVAYKETIRTAVKVEGKHKKQSGGRGQYGHCWLELEPLEKGKHFEFVDKIVGGVIPRNYIPSIEKGIRKTMEEGCIAGYPITDIRVAVYDGSYHTVDSSDMAFQIAGSLGLKKGMDMASPCLLEPIYDVETLVPEQFMGDVIGDLNGKRGRIMGMDPLPKGQQKIRAQVPLAEVQRYSIDLRSMTQGRGVYSMKFSHYEEVPAQIAEGIIAAYKKAREKEE
ncbi:MAG: elongation factor G [Candidatus Eremiobacteraeota bacterium]|nr:elongation factor G [Candidatus Eremiobacteraeota bacterium]